MADYGTVIKKIKEFNREEERLFKKIARIRMKRLALYRQLPAWWL